MIKNSKDRKYKYPDYNLNKFKKSYGRSMTADKMNRTTNKNYYVSYIKTEVTNRHPSRMDLFSDDHIDFSLKNKQGGLKCQGPIYNSNGIESIEWYEALLNRGFHSIDDITGNNFHSIVNQYYIKYNKHIDPNPYQGNYCLSQLASIKGYINILSFQYQNNVHLGQIKNSDGQYLFHLAASYGRFKVILLLLKIQVDISKTDNFKENILHLAADGSGTTSDLVRVLDIGIKYDYEMLLQPNSEGFLPIHWAALLGVTDLVYVLAKSCPLSIVLANNFHQTSIDLTYAEVYKCLYQEFGEKTIRKVNLLETNPLVDQGYAENDGLSGVGNYKYGYKDYGDDKTLIDPTIYPKESYGHTPSNHFQVFKLLIFYATNADIDQNIKNHIGTMYTQFNQLLSEKRVNRIISRNYFLE